MSVTFNFFFFVLIVNLYIYYIFIIKSTLVKSFSCCGSKLFSTSPNLSSRQGQCSKSLYLEHLLQLELAAKYNLTTFLKIIKIYYNNLL